MFSGIEWNCPYFAPLWFQTTRDGLEENCLKMVPWCGSMDCRLFYSVFPLRSWDVFPQRLFNPRHRLRPLSPREYWSWFVGVCAMLFQHTNMASGVVNIFALLELKTQSHKSGWQQLQIVERSKQIWTGYQWSGYQWLPWLPILLSRCLPSVAGSFIKWAAVMLTCLQGTLMESYAFSKNVHEGIRPTFPTALGGCVLVFFYVWHSQFHNLTQRE